MPRVTTINSLPSEIQDALRQRLLTTGFGQYEEHSEWLREQGFSVSKSAIHRYASTHATTIKAQQQGGDSPSLVEVRLRCLEIASFLQPGGASELVRDAEDLLKWVYGH